MTTYHIYGMGAALVDTEIEVTDMDLVDLEIEKGVMTLVDEDRQSHLVSALHGHIVASNRASGGSAANSIIAASYFGAKTFYSCRVASDENGQFYLNDLANAGVEYHNRNGEAEGITGKCLVMITPDAERTMNTFLGISEHISIDDIDEQALQDSAFAYIEGYLVTSASGLPAAIHLRELAEKHGVKTALSLSDPAIVTYFHEGISQMVGKGVDILFCNQHEAQSFTKTDNLEDAVAGLKQFASTFAVTLGSKGALVFDGEKEIRVEAEPTRAVDTNGAGDMFAGAFLYGLSNGMNYRQAAELGCKAAARVVSQFGPRLKPDQHQLLLDG